MELITLRAALVVVMVALLVVSAVVRVTLLATRVLVSSLPSALSPNLGVLEGSVFETSEEGLFAFLSLSRKGDFRSFEVPPTATLDGALTGALGKRDDADGRDVELVILVRVSGLTGSSSSSSSEDSSVSLPVSSSESDSSAGFLSELTAELAGRELTVGLVLEVTEFTAGFPPLPSSSESSSLDSSELSSVSDSEPLSSLLKPSDFSFSFSLSSLGESSKLGGLEVRLLGEVDNCSLLASICALS